jgi:hypothetical protein
MTEYWNCLLRKLHHDFSSSGLSHIIARSFSRSINVTHVHHWLQELSAYFLRDLIRANVLCCSKCLHLDSCSLQVHVRWSMNIGVRYNSIHYWNQRQAVANSVFYPVFNLIFSCIQNVLIDIRLIFILFHCLFIMLHLRELWHHTFWD